MTTPARRLAADAGGRYTRALRGLREALRDERKAWDEWAVLCASLGAGDPSTVQARMVWEAASGALAGWCRVLPQEGEDLSAALRGVELEVPPRA